LQDRLEPRAKPSAHKAEVAAVLTRQQLKDRVCLPVTFDAKHDAFISPLHIRLMIRVKFYVTPSETPAPWRGSAPGLLPIPPPPSRTKIGGLSFRQSRRSPCGPPRRLP